MAWVGWCETGFSRQEQWDLLDRSIETAREAADPWALSFCIKLGYSYVPREDKDLAFKRARLEEALELAQTTGDPFLISQAVHGMGDIFYFLQLDEKAEPWFREALRMAMEIDDRWSIFDALDHLAEGFLRTGKKAKSLEAYAESLRLAAGLGARAYVGKCFLGMSEIARREGNDERAVRLRAAWSVIANPGEVLPPWPPDETFHSDPQSIAMDWAAGRRMGMEEAVAYALNGTG
jgi:tetratricopeptide (TPR) repeat protein